MSTIKLIRNLKISEIARILKMSLEMLCYFLDICMCRVSFVCPVRVSRAELVIFGLIVSLLLPCVPTNGPK